MRILEISRIGFFKSLRPDSTHWIRWGPPLTAEEPHTPEAFSLSAIASALWQIRNMAYDLIVLPAVQPNHRADQPRHKIIAKSMLDAMSGSQAASRLLNDLIIRSSRHVIVDLRDTRNICEATIRPPVTVRSGRASCPASPRKRHRHFLC
jgi:hypothetical protein